MCRKRGRIVLVGVTGLELSRADFYEKELTFQVSCSYGPGRYDPDYEEKGHDYPVGFVRWTEQRNFEAVLDMMARRPARRRAARSRTASPSTRPSAPTRWSAAAEPSLGILLDISGRANATGSGLRVSARSRSRRRHDPAGTGGSRLYGRLHRRGQLRDARADPGVQGRRRAARARSRRAAASAASTPAASSASQDDHDRCGACSRDPAVDARRDRHAA